MTMLAAVSLLAAIAFGLALCIFAYFFNKYMGREDTVDLALALREMNTTPSSSTPTRTKAAGAA